MGLRSRGGDVENWGADRGREGTASEAGRDMGFSWTDTRASPVGKKGLQSVTPPASFSSGLFGLFEVF